MKAKASNQLLDKILNALPGLTLVLALGAILAACGGGSPAEIAVGSPAPDFSLPTSNGSELSLDDYTGVKPVLLYFHMALG